MNSLMKYLSLALAATAAGATPLEKRQDVPDCQSGDGFPSRSFEGKLRLAAWSYIRSQTDDCHRGLASGPCEDNCYGTEKDQSSANYNGPCKGHCDGIGLTTGAVEWFCYGRLRTSSSDDAAVFPGSSLISFALGN